MASDSTSALATAHGVDRCGKVVEAEVQCGQQVQRRVLEGRVTRLPGQRDRLLRPLDGEADVVGKRLRHGDRGLDRV